METDHSYSATVTVKVRGFDEARHASNVIAVMGQTLAAALAAGDREAVVAAADRRDAEPVAVT